jgi:chromosome segregation ATPase
MKFDLRSLTRDFLVNEGKGPTVVSWIQSLAENINALKPRSLSEERRIEVMKHNLAELRRAARRMQEHITRLEEQVNVLQEEKND